MGGPGSGPNPGGGSRRGERPRMGVIGGKITTIKMPKLGATRSSMGLTRKVSGWKPAG